MAQSVPENSTLVFFVNGKKVVESDVDPEWTLLYYLRKKLRLCGTKLGCAEGGCGACTVMVSKYDRKHHKICHIAVNACLAPVCSMHGLAVTTVEGIGSTKTKLHPVQERIAKAHGSQCGFCTPGIVMSMYTLIRNNQRPSMGDLEVAFQGNLCRCTGYRSIIEGYKTFTENWEVMQQNGVMGIQDVSNNVCGMGKDCCKLQKNVTKHPDEEVLFKPNDFAPYDPSQEPIFPPELKLNSALDSESLVFRGDNVTWYRPNKLVHLLDLKSKHPDAKIIVGNTEVGVEVKFKHFVYPILVKPTQIPEMVEVKRVNEGLLVGASVTLQDMEDALRNEIRKEPGYKTRIFAAIVDILHWFAGKQVRNVAAVGGNIMTGSPISDLNPIFISSKILLNLQSKESGFRTVFMDENFFTGYRKNIVKPNELLISIVIPYSKESQYFYAYKQARRRDDDIAIVNAAINVVFKTNSKVIEDIDVAYGGMAPTTVTAKKTRDVLRGLVWDEAMLEKAYASLLEDLPLSPSAPGGMIQYRRSLTLSFFFRAFLAISQQLEQNYPEVRVDNRSLSGIKGFHSKPATSSQYFQVLPHEKMDTVGRPIVHASAYKQATGEAKYCDDMPFFENEVYMALVFSKKAHANVLDVDASEALQQKGVHAFFSHKDLDQHRNRIGPILQDEEIFASKKVTSQGQVLGAIVADDQAKAQRAARMVKVTYEDLSPVIVSIEDAIYHNSYHGPPKTLTFGDVDKVFATAPHTIENDCRLGAQEHFYLETHCTIAVPKGEDNEMDIYCATQHPSEINNLVSHVLGVPQNRITTKVKRLGGGFGGKEWRGCLVALPAAIAAHKLNRPVRCMLDRDEDMLMSGTRHPFYMKYKTAFDNDGKILACEIWIYNNAGYSFDLSTAVIERAMLNFQNGYKIPNVRTTGYVCKTNIPSNTVFRGSGGPQGMFAAEHMAVDIAEYLNRDVMEVRKVNLYKEGDMTHFNQTLENCTLERCWNECLQSACFAERKKEIEHYNRDNRWKKRGIDVIPTMFGIAFPVLHLNQAGALVHVYIDGSVLLSHGGTEMGQGLHTKMIQVASRVLGIPHSKIYINETATDKVPNTSPTAASSGSDLNGMAVMNACKTIRDRLEPVVQKNPEGTWEDWIKAAYLERISLSATGFYKTPDIGYDFETNTGKAFNYFVYGVACSEVEIDCLTGDHRVLRTDIVMDLGESLNPAIDIGQIEGGFMQGYGLFVLEEMVYSPNGTCFTRGPGAYKLPGFADIPLEFNVSLLKGASNPRAVYSSKAVGEPPLFLASSIYFALTDAVKAARKEAGLENVAFRLNAPATSAKIRMACQDNLTAKLEEPKAGSFVPWNIIP